MTANASLASLGNFLISDFTNAARQAQNRRMRRLRAAVALLAVLAMAAWVTPATGLDSQEESGDSAPEPETCSGPFEMLGVLRSVGIPPCSSRSSSSAGHVGTKETPA